MNQLFRRGQVFLLVTILVVSFMIGISTILLDIQRSDYLEPAPDSFETYEAWDVTHTALLDILDIYLAQSTTVGEPANIDEQLSDLEAYLVSRGMTTATISQIGSITYTPVNAVLTNLETVSVTGEFFIYLSSVRGTKIEQNLVIDISYTLDASQANTLILSRVTNGEVDYLTGASFSDTSGLGTFQDNGNGSYDHTVAGGNTITCTTLSSVVIEVEI